MASENNQYDANDRFADEVGVVSLNQEDVSDFLRFLSSEETYLDTGLGAFHTDDHSNW